IVSLPPGTGNPGGSARANAVAGVYTVPLEEAGIDLQRLLVRLARRVYRAQKSMATDTRGHGLYSHNTTFVYEGDVERNQCPVHIKALPGRRRRVEKKHHPRVR